MSSNKFSRNMTVCLVVLIVLLPVTFANAANASSSVITVTQRQNIHVVYDVSHNVLEAGIGKALYYVRGLLEAYKDMGVPAKALHISVVVHGAAAYWLLKPDA